MQNDHTYVIMKNNESWKMKNSLTNFLKVAADKHDINIFWPYFVEVQLCVKFNLILKNILSFFQ